MMRKVQVVLQDDINGEEPAQTVYFSLDGKAYEIDLTEQNAAELRDALAPWIAAARRASTAADTLSRDPSRAARGHGRHPALGQGERHPGQRPRAHLRRPAHPVRGRALTVAADGQDPNAATFAEATSGDGGRASRAATACRPHPCTAARRRSVRRCFRHRR